MEAVVKGTQMGWEMMGLSQTGCRLRRGVSGLAYPPIQETGWGHRTWNLPGVRMKASRVSVAKHMWCMRASILS